MRVLSAILTFFLKTVTVWGSSARGAVVSPRSLLKNDLDIRRGTREDVGVVLGLLDEAVAWLVDRGQTGQWGTEAFSARPAGREQIHSAVADGDLRIAERGEQPVGALIVGNRPPHVPPVDQPELYINLLVSSRRHAGQAIGVRLVEIAIDLARAQGARLLRVDCWARASTLVAWYERQGFARDGAFELHGWQGQILHMALPPDGDPAQKRS